MSAGLFGLEILLCLPEPSNSTAVYIVKFEYSVVKDKYFFKLSIPNPVKMILPSLSNIIFFGLMTP